MGQFRFETLAKDLLARLSIEKDRETAGVRETSNPDGRVYFRPS